jgi:hypothetical protein
MIWPGQSPEHDSDHREADESDDGARGSLEVAREAAVVADPRERALDDPAFGQDDELMQAVALDDFDNPMTGAGGGVRHITDFFPHLVGRDTHGEGSRSEGGESGLDRGLVAPLICAQPST